MPRLMIFDLLILAVTFWFVYTIGKSCSIVYI
jgi:hypothetical protein